MFETENLMVWSAVKDAVSSVLIQKYNKSTFWKILSEELFCVIQMYNDFYTNKEKDQSTDQCSHRIQRWVVDNKSIFKDVLCMQH